MPDACVDRELGSHKLLHALSFGELFAETQVAEPLLDRSLLASSLPSILPEIKIGGKALGEQRSCAGLAGTCTCSAACRRRAAAARPPAAGLADTIPAVDGLWQLVANG